MFFPLSANYLHHFFLFLSTSGLSSTAATAASAYPVAACRNTTEVLNTFTAPSVTFLQKPRSKLTEALE